METNTTTGMMRITGTVPCDQPLCEDGFIMSRGVQYTCPQCSGTGRQPVYEPSTVKIVIRDLERGTDGDL